MSYVYKFKFGFTKLGVATSPASGTTTIVIDDGDIILVSGSSLSPAPIDGEYRYSYTGSNGLDLVGLAHTSDLSMDQYDLYSYTNGFLQVEDTSIATILADYARRTGDYATVAALATLQGNVTTILADYARRTGDYATVLAVSNLQADITTILGDYARRTGDYSTLTALQVWTYVTRTLTSANVLTATDIADIWAYVSRTLTQSGINVQAAVAGNEITVTRGNTLQIALTGLGSLSNYVSLLFTVKHSYDDPDASALIQIKKNLSGLNDGLLYINGGVATTAANGSLTLTSLPLGNITINLTAAECAKLSPHPDLKYDIKLIQSAGILQYTMRTGKFVLESGVTKAIV